MDNSTTSHKKKPQLLIEEIYKTWYNLSHVFKKQISEENDIS